MAPTRIRTLILAAIVCAIAVRLLLPMVYADIPPLPWTGVPALLILTLAEALSGRNLRARLHGQSQGRPLNPIAVARMAALAKASSLAAAIFAGLSAGFVLYVVGSLDKVAYRSDAFVGGGTLAAAIALTVAALYLENSCRVPPSDDEQEANASARGPS
jgi:Protein of unknown function (DUF3180)